MFRERTRADVNVYKVALVVVLIVDAEDVLIHMASDLTSTLLRVHRGKEENFLSRRRPNRILQNF